MRPRSATRSRPPEPAQSPRSPCSAASSASATEGSSRASGLTQSDLTLHSSSSTSTRQSVDAQPHGAWCEQQAAQAVSGARFTPVLPARSAEECARGREARNEAAKAIDLMFDLSAWGEER